MHVSTVVHNNKRIKVRPVIIKMSADKNCPHTNLCFQWDPTSSKDISLVARSPALTLSFWFVCGSTKAEQVTTHKSPRPRISRKDVESFNSCPNQCTPFSQMKCCQCSVVVGVAISHDDIYENYWDPQKISIPQKNINYLPPSPKFYGFSLQKLITVRVVFKVWYWFDWTDNN